MYVETQAGEGIGFSDQDYLAAGAQILPTAEAVFAESDMIVKVKEPQAVERAMLREGQLLFTYLHLAPDPEQTHDLINSKAVCIAYETVTDEAGRLPLLAPMSEVAGRMSIQAGAFALEKSRGGRGMLLAGVPGVEPANVVIIGGGVVGPMQPKWPSGFERMWWCWIVTSIHFVVWMRNSVVRYSVCIPPKMRLKNMCWMPIL
ncbi:alanine dehydrogenase [Photobacterium aphoticum]|uniref:Alanine dehydrogenase n=1 Tax=Photobacterium aphoticum TaxID=754436 RepID=A0A090RMD4_9GAMM|nr:alanine dehydrogenase [Photobacterium aphoticum]